MEVLLNSRDRAGISYLTKFTDHVPGDLIPLKSDNVTVGRFACDVSVQDVNVSRDHCCLKRLGKRWVLIDLKSLNGTYIGNNRLKPNSPYPLHNGHVISIGPPNTASTTFLYTSVEEDNKQHKIIIDGSKKNQVGSVGSDVCRSITSFSVLKRKSDEQNSDKAMWDSQRTAVPSVSPSLDGDDGVSDSSMSSTDSLKTRIRKMYAANRKKSESSENSLRVPSTSSLGFNFQRYPHAQQGILIDCSSVKLKKKFKRLDEKNISRAEFRVLDTLCNEPESSVGAFSGSESSESLLNDNVRVSESHPPSEGKAIIAEKAEKTVNEDKEAVVRLAYEVEKARLKALEGELEMLKARARKQQSEEFEKLLEHFACIICAEIIDEPMVLNCSHSMCQYCLLKWKRKQNRCPICREKIVYEIKNLLIRNFIDKTIEGMDVEFQANRRKLVSERQKEIASWPKKKKKRSRGRNFQRRTSGINAVNNAGEGPSNFRGGSFLDLLYYSDDSE
ncbi:e3 ubiquitin-protein ligase rnf8 [Trichonephila clavata]|uniref:E3 ubiquitin-protein ligase CHFR n=1 Tax=Trichonephila clavata TaxID=2740835 RepID=A0A8X6HYR6_TRICU|nr:e3 ubiquitin-protein ligase rnf8 [Trichonephila clavata]